MFGFEVSVRYVVVSFEFTGIIDVVVVVGECIGGGGRCVRGSRGFAVYFSYFCC